MSVVSPPISAPLSEEPKMTKTLSDCSLWFLRIKQLSSALFTLKFQLLKAHVLNLDN
ncbi:hypothetical protein H8959_003539 [Pygathrix nigripes]